MRTWSKLGVAPIALFTVALLTAACSQGTSTTRAGGEAGPVTLRIGTYEVKGAAASDQIVQFAEEVRKRSKGSLRIEPVFNAVQLPGDDFDQQVARRVMDGKLDGGNIPARAWDVVGVKTLRALNTPFLVTSEPAMNDIATGEVAPELLAGLDGVGVTGLGLVPEGLRRLVYFGDDVVPVGEMNGRKVRSPRSDTVYAVLRALGGTPEDFGDDFKRFAGGIKDGSVVAAESSLALGLTLPENGTVAANAVLFPKLNTMVLNTEVFSGLDRSQQTALRDAAAATAGWWMDEDERAPDEPALAKRYCGNGGRVVTVGETELAAMRTAVAPVVAKLQADPATGALIDRIRARVAGITAPVVPACQPQAVEEVPAGAGIGDFPLGTYRVSFTQEEVVAGGVSPEDAQGYGSSTWTLDFRKDGIMTWTEPDGYRCEEKFTERQGRIWTVLTPRCPNGTAGDLDFAADWRLDGDRLYLTNVSPGPDTAERVYTVVFAKGLTRLK